MAIICRYAGWSFFTSLALILMVKLVVFKVYIRNFVVEITGSFDVNTNPLKPYGGSKAGITIGRMSIDKTFHGDLSATSKGEMLSALSPVKGSAGYVAIELVTGELFGMAGSFALQHFGIMENGNQELILQVIPDSGTGDLKTISGTMQIKIEAGQHYYIFNYNL